VNYPNTMTREILNYIKSNPTGCSLRDILEVLPEDTKPRSVNTILGYLKRAKAIENNGERGLNARWYPVMEEVDPKYYKIARDLQDEILEVHHTFRTEYLARRLQEIFDS
jgi:hypothetical protein